MKVLHSETIRAPERQFREPAALHLRRLGDLEREHGRPVSLAPLFPGSADLKARFRDGTVASINIQRRDP